MTQRDSIERVNILEHPEFSSERSRIHYNNKEQKIKIIVHVRFENPNLSSFYKED